MSKLRRWMPSIICLLVVWLGVGWTVHIVSSGRPSTAATLDLVDAMPAAAEARLAWIALLASRLRALDLDARHRVLMAPHLRSTFIAMSQDERSLFLASIEPSRWREFVEGTKGWSAGRYERLIHPALADLESLKTGSSARCETLLAEPVNWRIGNGGIDSIFKDADLLTRFDTQPFIERIQKYSQLGR